MPALLRSLQAVRRLPLAGSVARYLHWLHLRWPSGTVEKMPEVREHGTTNVEGLYVVGDLSGIPLLKLSADSGVRAVRHLAQDTRFRNRKAETRDDRPVHDLVVLGGGVSGHAAALEARRLGLDTVLLEASQAFSTIHNFPKGKPIYTYPSDMTPAGDLQFHADVKEDLLEELADQVGDLRPTIGRAERVVRTRGLLRVERADAPPLLAHAVVVAIGRSGNYRRLDVPGEDADKVYNRLHDPGDFRDKDVLVVGGGDSALETAVAVAEQGGRVTLSYRKDTFSRPKPDNIDRVTALREAGTLDVVMNSRPTRIEADQVTLAVGDDTRTLPNDVVFTMLGREAPLDFFRRSGVRITGESTPLGRVALVLFAVFIFALYDWKNKAWAETLWHRFVFPGNVAELIAGLGSWWQAQAADHATLIGTLSVSMHSRSFYYTLAYTCAIGFFGVRRILRRRTPYVTAQTTSLFLVQLLPLFLLPEIILPYLDYNGWFHTGFGRTVMDHLFELYISPADFDAGNWPAAYHPRAYWRAYGFILAWPLNMYNVTTASPLPWWLAIGALQTFVIIPLLVYRYGKGAYCGWICSCGGLAETMGDNQRHKMPHGPRVNRLNVIGQIFLVAASLLFLWRVLAWIVPDSGIARLFPLFFEGRVDGKLVNPFAYGWFVDVLFGGFFGVAFYFKYSGRVWCRFACPLAALMHIYARFTRFRIFSEKKKCISCNVCTSVCHQGIDVMNFANKGLPMEDPQCVRCSACVQSCPTGTLQFGRKTDDAGGFRLDSLPASPVVRAEQAPMRV